MGKYKYRHELKFKISNSAAEVLKQKAADLVELAKTKGTPVLEGVASDLKQKAIDVTKDVLKKLNSKRFLDW